MAPVRMSTQNRLRKSAIEPNPKGVGADGSKVVSSGLATIAKKPLDFLFSLLVQSLRINLRLPHLLPSPPLLFTLPLMWSHKRSGHKAIEGPPITTWLFYWRVTRHLW